MPLYLGVDVGTQSTKAVVYDSKRRKVVSRGAEAYPIIKTDVPGRAEQNPAAWIKAATTAINEALNGVDRDQVQGIGISGQQHGLVALDNKGQVIRNAKLWCDLEATEQAKRLSDAVGWEVVPGFTAPKIWWLKDNEPENFDRMAHVLLPHDYMNYFLTGEMVMECGDASGTGVFDVFNRTHDERAMAAIDAKLASCFPPLVGADEPIGTLLPAVAERLGLGAGVVVAPGSGDNMMSALGAGAVQHGDLVVSLGTSGTMFAPSKHPVFDRTGTIAPFCSATGDWLPLLCTMNCTGPPDAVRSAFDMDLPAITAAAEAAPPGCRGVNFLPYLAGERTPQWPHATGAILGLKPGSLSPGVLYRAALEGSTFSLLAGLGLLRDNGVPAEEALVVGGGSKSRLWRQIIADILRIPLKFPLEAESAALGGALQAAAVHQGIPVAEFVAANKPELEQEVVLPNVDVADVYAEAYQRHCSLGQTLFDRGE